MRKFKHHKYTYQNRFGNPSHQWELVGPDGGIHFHFNHLKDYSDTAGLEFHHSRSANYRPETAPDHTHCPLTGEPCWHDGTSMYATETLLPVIKPMLEIGDHESVFRLLEREYVLHFKKDEESV